MCTGIREEPGLRQEVRLVGRGLRKGQIEVAVGIMVGRPWFEQVRVSAIGKKVRARALRRKEGSGGHRERVKKRDTTT